MAMSSSPLQALQTSDVGAGMDSRTWNEIYDQEFDKCFRLVLRSGVLAADAEEIVQKVFVVALRRSQELEQVLNAGAWLRRITLNIVAEHYRWRRVRRLKAWMLPSSAGVVPAESPAPEEELSRAETQAKVHEVLGAMSAKLRDALVLIEMEGLKPQEAAEVLGCPVNTVRSRKRLAALEFERRWLALQKEGSE